MRLIDADKLQEALVKKKCGSANIKYTDGFNDALLKVKSMVHSATTIEAVHMEVYKQVVWERDTAVRQLKNDYGVEPGG